MKKLRNNIVIGICFFFCAINCIIAWIFSLASGAGDDNSILVLGIIMAIMIPVSIIDPREEMQSSLAVVCYIFMHILFNILVIILYSYYWLFLLFIPETAMLIIFVISRRNKRRK